MITPNEFFDDIFCINLDRRSDRWSNMNNKFRRENIFVTRWSATDSKTYEVKNDYNLLLSEKPYTNIKNVGGYAILLTYLKLFKHIQKQKYEKVLIFEDDVSFITNFGIAFDYNIQNLPNNWQMWALGCSQYGVENLKYTNDFNFFQPSLPNRTYGLFSFAIKQSYIYDVIQMLELRDSYADTRIYTHTIENKSDIYISCPPICSHENGYSDNKEIIRNQTNVLEYCPCNELQKYQKYF